MREKILTDLKNAMKNQNKDLLNVIRMVKGSVQLEEIKLKRELNDDEVIAVIAKQIKSKKDTIAEITNSDRQDLIKQLEKDIDILNKYMPELMSKEEIIKIIDNAFNEINPTSPVDTGKIMGKVSPLLKGKADMTLVNKIVKEKLNNL